MSKNFVVKYIVPVLLGLLPLVVKALLSSLVPLFVRLSSEQRGKSKQHTNQLSWQSALWAILAIALTDMADLPTKVGGYPEQLAFFLKASPWTCLSNVINTTVVMTASVRSHGWSWGLKRAMMELSVRKFGVEGAAHVTRRSVRMLLFVLGALPQAVKLFSCRGIPALQFIAACYLLDFTNDEIILWFTQSKFYQQQKNDNPASVVNEHLNTLSPYVPQYDWFFVDCSFVLNLCWTTALTSTGIMFLDPLERAVPGFATLSTAVTLMLVLYVDSKSWISLSRHARFELRLLVLGTIAPTIWMSALFSFQRKDGSFMSWTEIISSRQALQLLLIMQAASNYSDWARRTFGVYEREYANDFPAFAHTFLFSFALGMYFAAHYEASATYKPGWVEWLG